MKRFNETYEDLCDLLFGIIKPVNTVRCINFFLEENIKLEDVDEDLLTDTAWAIAELVPRKQLGKISKRELLQFIANKLKAAKE